MKVLLCICGSGIDVLSLYGPIMALREANSSLKIDVMMPKSHFGELMGHPEVNAFLFTSNFGVPDNYQWRKIPSKITHGLSKGYSKIIDCSLASHFPTLGKSISISDRVGLYAKIWSKYGLATSHVSLEKKPETTSYALPIDYERAVLIEEFTPWHKEHNIRSFCTRIMASGFEVWSRGDIPGAQQLPVSSSTLLDIAHRFKKIVTTGGFMSSELATRATGDILHWSDQQPAVNSRLVSCNAAQPDQKTMSRIFGSCNEVAVSDNKTDSSLCIDLKMSKLNAERQERLNKIKEMRSSPPNERIGDAQAMAQEKKQETDKVPVHASIGSPSHAPGAKPRPKLSVLICSTSTRAGTFLPKIFAQLEQQTSGRSDVELIAIVDNKFITVGSKRNSLLSLANGQYVVFVDDDDVLEDCYISEIVSATASGADVICFDLMLHVSNKQDKVVHYSKDFGCDTNEATCYKRIPNHIMCFKRELAARVQYANLTFGEDSEWAKRILPLIKTEHQIGKILYRYMYNPRTSEATTATQTQVLAKQKMKVDVVMPSLSKPELHRMIKDCISSLRASEQNIDFNVILVESGPHKVDLGQDQTVMFDLPKFNFNHALKQGIEKCSSAWIVLANNDLVFHRNWMAKLLQFAEKNPEIGSFSPWDPRSHPSHFRQPAEHFIGYEVTKHIAGWCLIMTSDVLSKVQLSEEIEYWYSDNNYADELKKHKIVHALLRNSVVTHLCEQTTRKMDNKQQMTVDQKALYEKIKPK